MNMKKMMFAGLMTAVLVLTSACAPQPAATPEPAPAPEAAANALADGNYFAQGDFDAKSGWKYMVTLEVKDGKIASVDWNGASINGGTDKKTTSKDGKYGMKEKGGAITDGEERTSLDQAGRVMKKETKAITLTDADGHTDAVSGATIKVKDFVELTEKALAAGPVEKGPYKDGAYHAEAKEFAEKSGWKETVDLTVVNGHIVAANWNGVHKDGGDDKKTQSKDGRYGMKEKGGAVAEWHEQAALVEAFLLEKQDPAAITLVEDGKTDAVSGATIGVDGFVELVNEALASAK